MKLKLFDFNFQNLGSVMDVPGEFADAIQSHVVERINSDFSKWNMGVLKRERSFMGRVRRDEDKLFLGYIGGTVYRPQFSQYENMVIDAKLVPELHKEVMGSVRAAFNSNEDYSDPYRYLVYEKRKV